MSQVIKLPKKPPRFAFWVLPEGSREREAVLKELLEMKKRGQDA